MHSFLNLGIVVDLIPSREHATVAVQVSHSNRWYVKSNRKPNLSKTILGFGVTTTHIRITHNDNGNFSGF